MDWKARLMEKGALVTDGASGTELAKRGLPAGYPTELWNVENPDAVEAVARSYVDAGSDIILTNTFGASPLKLEKAGLADRTAELNRAAVEIARRAAGDRAMVFASIGPTGEFIAPLGTHTEQEFVDCFAAQIEACAEGGAQGLCIETMTALDESRAALAAADRVAPGLPKVVSMTYTRVRTGFATMMGVFPGQAARELEAAGADIVGSNCGAGIRQMILIASQMRRATILPLWIKPNAGMPELVDGRTVFRETPEEMARHVEALIVAGASLIGGCCGTTPEHVRAFAEAIEAERDAALELGRPIFDRLKE